MTARTPPSVDRLAVAASGADVGVNVVACASRASDSCGLADAHRRRSSSDRSRPGATPSSSGSTAGSLASARCRTMPAAGRAASSSSWHDDDHHHDHWADRRTIRTPNGRPMTPTRIGRGDGIGIEFTTSVVRGVALDDDDPGPAEVRRRGGHRRSAGRSIGPRRPHPGARRTRWRHGADPRRHVPAGKHDAPRRRHRAQRAGAEHDAQHDRAHPGRSRRPS